MRSLRIRCFEVTCRCEISADQEYEEDNIKMSIVGDGIIGVIDGWALSHAGNDVTHYVRKGIVF
jgi:hypothetical protein